MSNSALLKMILPTGLKMLQNPSLKIKLIELFSQQKQKFVQNENEDVRIILFSTQDNIFAKIVSVDKGTGEILEVIAIYKFEELVEMLSKIKL